MPIFITLQEPMPRILQAICHNGELVLTEKLDMALEGKTLNIMILESSDSNQPASLDSRSVIAQFLEKVQQYSFQLPPDYKFSRDEIYD